MLKLAASSNNIYEIPKSTLYTGYANTQPDNMGVFGVYREQDASHVTYYDKRKWTFSTWFKLAGNPMSPPNTVSLQPLLSAQYNNENTHGPHTTVYINTDRSMVFGVIHVGTWGSNPTIQGCLKTKMKFVDFGAWYHVTAVYDSNYPVREDRMRLYINGVRVTEFDNLSEIGGAPSSTSFYPPQGLVSMIGACNGEEIYNSWDGTPENAYDSHKIVSQSKLQIGHIGSVSNWVTEPYYSDMYMADTYLINGSALEPTEFGKVDYSTNQWIPIKYDMNKLQGQFAISSFRINSNDDWNPVDVYGATFPFMLKFNMGYNRLNNTNHAATDFTNTDYPTGVWQYKRFFDTPTNNVCCMNNNNLMGVGVNTRNGFQVRNSNIIDIGTNPSWEARVQGTMAVPLTGKWCFFGTMNQYVTGKDLHIGVCAYFLDMNKPETALGPSIVLKNNGKVHIDGTPAPNQEANPTPFVDIWGSIIVGVYIDSDNLNVKFRYRTGNSSSTAADFFTTPTYPLAAVEYMPFASGSSQGYAWMSTQFGEINIGGDLDGWDKVGYKLITTKNLPAPRIKIPQKYFKNYTWTGNGTSQQIGELQKPLDLYDCGKSIIFDGGSIYRTIQSATNSTKWAFSTWFRNVNPTKENYIISATGVGGSEHRISIIPNSAVNGVGSIKFLSKSNSTTTQFQAEVNYDVADNNWHHLFILYNSTGATGELEFYVDGNVKNYQFTAGTVLLATNVLSNMNTFNQSGQTYLIGGTVGTNKSNIQLADLYFLDGSLAKNPTYCTQLDANGYLVPKAFTGKDNNNLTNVSNTILFGNNGFHFDWRNATGVQNLGTTVPGHGDQTTWTVTTPSFAGYNFISKDTPSNAFAVFDGNNKISADLTYGLSKGNLVVGGRLGTVGTTYNFDNYRSTLKLYGNNYYFEFEAEKFNGYGTAYVQVYTKSYLDQKKEYFAPLTGINYSANYNAVYYPNPALQAQGGGDQEYGQYGLVFDDTLSHSLSWGKYGFAIDIKRGYIWVVSINTSTGVGTWLDGKDPDNSFNDPYTKIPIFANEEYYVEAYCWRTENHNELAKLSFNFGQFNFTYQAPERFLPLCENTVNEYTSDMEVPYLVWIKSRNLQHGTRVFNQGLNRIDDTRAYDGGSFGGVMMFDSYDIAIAENLAEQPFQLTSYNKNGFTVGHSEVVNQKNEKYVAWAWKDGDIPGVYIKQFDGNTSNTPIPHNLKTPPVVSITKMLVPPAGTSLPDSTNLVFKSILFGNRDWNHVLSMGGQYDLYSLRSSGMAAPTLPDSNNYYHNVPPAYYGAVFDTYLFAPVEGFSKFGTYIGSGAPKYVHLGFRPAFVMFKAIHAPFGNYDTFIDSGWTIIDTGRDLYNGNRSKLINPSSPFYTEQVMVNNSYELFGNADTYLLSTGFKLMGTNQNQIGFTYFFMAFAEAPLKYSNAR